MDDSQKKCFVIMPYGIKKDQSTGKDVDFEIVYESIIKQAVEDMGIAIYRSDKIKEGGVIVEDMFHHILYDDVAVVDITTSNANVFYELGVRHALRASVTIIIRQKSSLPIPYNIQSLKVFEYDLENRETSRKTLSEFILNGLKNQNQKPDSLVQKHIGKYFKVQMLGAENEPLPHKVHDFELKDVPGKHVGIITGDLQKVVEVDIWVNSENTNMQMARYYDRNISGVIRYLGAEKSSSTKRVKRDTIADELLENMDGETYVDGGTIISTSSGQLEKSHNVKKVFHAASVNGQIGKGYIPIQEVNACVTNALRKVDDDFGDEGYKSILFPIMGAGAGGADLRASAKQLIDAAISYLEIFTRSTIKYVYFLAWSERERAACEEILASNSRLKRLTK
ncbi:macro domain-containing protein [Stenomitos frigidus]|uniref:Macro domain-containing protein n=1 Tax=Stenomitos frigidus ULC18 TaxID=2107698 RepID=A0A2T1DYA2_9CYAN|nr:macro domain-containing protein [Stenomitos frigidus]PSB25503.1 hypothetical protein C7B82_23040 [Stenomitos frigidus ULC18]